MASKRRNVQGRKPIRVRARRPDRAIGAAGALDRAAERYAAAFDARCTFMGWFDPDGVNDWSDDVEIVLKVLGSRAGPALARLAEMNANLKVAESEDARAYAELTSIRPTSPRGEACYRAAVARYARRSTGHAFDEEFALNLLGDARSAA